MGETLHWADYLVCGLSLVLSLACGLFSAWRHRGEGGSLEEYTLGSRRMNPVMVGISLIASLVDPGTIILYPAEVYMFGSIVTLLCLGIALSIFFSITFIIPIFHKMQLTSVYEYIEYRFNSKLLRFFASIMYVIFIVLESGIILYIPVLAFVQVTGLDMWVPILIFGGTCVIYTAMGGFRAVIMVDAIQMCAMLGAIFLVIILGTIQTGGVNAVVENSRTGGRFNYKIYTADPRVRYTIWTATVAQFFYAMANVCAGQMSVQRFLSVDQASLRKMGWLSLVLAFITTALSSLQGLVVYAYYHGCDPITNEDVAKPEQLLPHFVMDLISHLHGLPGLYVASLFAAAMSTLSSSINSICALMIQDFVRPIVKKKWKRELKTSEIRRLCTGLSLLIGIVSVASTFLPDIVGGLVVEINRLLVVGALVPILTVFLLGIFIPWANIWGAYAGWITSTVLGLWFGIGNHIYGRSSKVRLALSTNQCPADSEMYSNYTTVHTEASTYDTSGLEGLSTEASEIESDPLLQPLYDISFVWFSMYAILGGLIVGSLVSFFTSGLRLTRHPDVNPDHVFNYKDCCLCLCFCGAKTDSVDLSSEEEMNTSKEHEKLATITRSSYRVTNGYNVDEKTNGVENKAYEFTLI